MHIKQGYPLWLHLATLDFAQRALQGAATPPLDPSNSALIQTSLRFVCRAVCDAQKTEKRREFSGQDVGMSDRARALRHSPPGQGCAPTPSTPCQMHVKKSLRASGKPSKSVAVITNVSEAR